jgi:hypothetical protein
MNAIFSLLIAFEAIVIKSALVWKLILLVGSLACLAVSTFSTIRVALTGIVIQNGEIRFIKFRRTIALPVSSVGKIELVSGWANSFVYFGIRTLDGKLIKSSFGPGTNMREAVKSARVERFLRATNDELEVEKSRK